ncbi:hypothetical protein VCRA2128O95_10402 [Vibrio crassostreae]|nr:hypothetical protein VCRA2128O105_10395 [Vibrio crassostreae]CAK3282545.1 hypothetical protein VCRA2126O88_10041 [Vibrio crassostreae]CAK3756127.1 hypothetical protein VCRA2125O78_10527 [Vibrio crassostreae]CAK3795628.1 hypothetical protein VCRA2128O95_10402 [Vibrio crassostreae]
MIHDHISDAGTEPTYRMTQLQLIGNGQETKMAITTLSMDIGGRPHRIKTCSLVEHHNQK